MIAKQLIFMGLAILGLVVWQPGKIMAAPPLDGEGQDYTVQADDWLSKLADKFYGDPLAYLVIVEATNRKAVQDISYTAITDPDIIEIGQKLFVPITDEISRPVVEAARDSNIMPEEAVVPTESQLQLLATLNVKGTPPELHNEVWLNSEPLKLANLQGKVVIVEFWTFG